MEQYIASVSIYVNTMDLIFNEGEFCYYEKKCKTTKMTLCIQGFPINAHC